MHTRRGTCFSLREFSAKKKPIEITNRKYSRKNMRTVAFSWMDFRMLHVYICTYTHIYIFTPNTTFFRYWFLFILPKVVVHNWNSGFQSITQSSTHISINNKSYYNKCNLSCSLFTFPFFNCMFSFFQLCVIDLRWRLQRKTSL